MPKRMKKMTAKDWVTLAGSLFRDEGPEDNRSEIDVFNTMVLYAKSLMEQDVRPRWKTCLAVMHIVYAWMPTMLRIGGRVQNRGPINERVRRQVCRATARAIRGKKLSVAQLSLLRDVINGSVVGTSKYLHCLNSAVYPIWDKRAAVSYLGRKAPRTNDVEKYLEYMTELQEWREEECVINELRRLRELSKQFRQMTDMRILEFVLYYRRG